MCGIAAYWDSSCSLRATTMDSMLASMISRGPDHSGSAFFDFNGGALGLGARRLSIVGRGELGNQPIRTYGFDGAMVFNGEVFNYRAIRKELMSYGYGFRSQSDGEVLLRAFLHWGESSFAKLDAMFSLVIYDALRGRLIFARDKCGEKPLYKRRLPGGGIALASSKAALIGAEFPRSTLDLDVLARCVNGLFPYGTESTVFAEITSTPAAQLFELDLLSGNERRFRYWMPQWQTSAQPANDCAYQAQVEAALLHGVQQRGFAPEAAIAISLSGGLDSGLLTSLVSELAPEELAERYTILSCFTGDMTRDTDYHLARESANRLGLHPIWVPVTAESAADSLSTVVRSHLDVLTDPSVLMEWELMRVAASLGIRVILDGQGADELFAGYGTYVFANFAELIRTGNWARLSGELQLTNQLLHNRMGNSDLLVGPQYLKLLDQALRCWLGTNRKYKSSIELCMGLDPAGSDILRKRLVFEFLCGALPYNLSVGDTNSMAHSVELRHPYLNTDIVKLASRLPDCQLIRDGWPKVVLRKVASPRLPPEVVWNRTKIAYEAPISAWMKQMTFRSWIFERVRDPVVESIPSVSKERIEVCERSALRGDKGAELTLFRVATAAELIRLTQGS